MSLIEYAGLRNRMAEIAGEKTERVFNLLGLARRAGKLFVGQDKVLAAAKSGAHLLVITSNDVSAAVARSLRPHEEKGSVRTVLLADADRNRLGRHLGISSAQIAALSGRDGLAKKIINIFNDGSVAGEQN